MTLYDGLVSCFMPTRGRANHVGRALQCFASQTYPALELVVIHQGLDDEARALLEAETRARLIEAPAGVSLGALKNAALAECRGEFVCNWDDDDIHAPTRIDEQLRFLHLQKADACILRRVQLRDETNGLSYTSAARLWEGTLIARRELSALLEGFPDQTCGEDTALVERLSARHHVALLDGPALYAYCYHGGNATSRAHFYQLVHRARHVGAVAN